MEKRIRRLTATQTGPVYVDNKWVYIFYKQGNEVSLLRECKPLVKNDTQRYEFVSWAEDYREDNCKKYPRPLNENADRLQLEPDREYYILLSQIQQTLARIDYYTKNTDQLHNGRCMFRLVRLTMKLCRSVYFSLTM
jgi:hypothetical protein